MLEALAVAVPQQVVAAAPFLGRDHGRDAQAFISLTAARVPSRVEIPRIGKNAS